MRAKSMTDIAERRRERRRYRRKLPYNTAISQPDKKTLG